MTAQQACNAVYMGQMVDCTKEEYESEVRSALQEYAGRKIDHGDPMRAQIALMEVKRLDAKFAGRS